MVSSEEFERYSSGEATSEERREVARELLNEMETNPELAKKWDTLVGPADFKFSAVDFDEELLGDDIRDSFVNIFRTDQ